jgi:hypothetical protein
VSAEILYNSPDAIRGIALNGSTSWDGIGTDWDEQTGYTTRGYSSTATASGRVDELYNTGGTYYFFATASNLTAVFTTDSNENDYRMLTVGTCGGFTSYFASGGTRDNYSTGSYDALSSYCAKTTTGFSASINNHCALYIPTEGWYNMWNIAESPNTTRIMRNLINSNTATDTAGIYGSVSAEILYNSPDAIRGNAQFAPSLTTITKGLSSELWPIGEIEGVKFINMTNYADGQEITLGTDTYKLFHIYQSGSTGVAFLK